MKRIFALLFITAFSFAVCASFGQGEPGGIETHGSVTAGYRFTDVAGRVQKFNELFALRNGFRVHDVTLYGATEGNKFLDSYSLNASGIGGDPFMGSQFVLTKDRLYDLRINYRQSYYYFNRNDDQSQPSGLHGLMTNHDFATVRRIGSVNLSYYLTSRLRASLDYQRSERSGTTFTTRTLDYFGAPATYAGFLRSNPYYVEAPTHATFNRVTGGFSYAVRDWNVFYRVGQQRDGETLDLRNPLSPQRSINIDEAATANEQVNVASWHEFRRSNSPVSEFSYNGAIRSRLRLRGGYIYYRYAGPATINAEFNGNARTTNATTIAPFSASVRDSAALREPNHIIDQGFSLSLTDNILFHADYRYSRFTMNSSVEHETTDGAGSHTGEEDVAWREGLQILDVAIEVTPNPKLHLRPGIRLMKRDLAMTRDDVLDAAASRPSKYASPLISFYYAPTDKFSFRGDLRNITNGGPYTRISPRSDFRTRLVGHYNVSSAVSLENNFNMKNAEYSATQFLNRTRSNSTMVTLALNKNYSVFGGFIYDSFLATAGVTFLRGTAPLSATWRDQTINRVWEGGVEAHPVVPVELKISGNYLRTTGVGEISLEPPISGPVRWPMVTGTVSFNIPRAGKLALDLQRSYYIEELLTGDNFSANILDIRWTKEF